MIKVNLGIKWSELLIYVLFYMSSTKDYQFSPLLPDFLFLVKYQMATMFDDDRGLQQRCRL